MANKKIFMLTRYNSEPSIYDERYRNIQQTKYRLAQKLNPSQELTLDVGIGTGIIFSLYHPIERYVGIDLSVNSLEFLRKRYPTQHGLVINADLEFLPLRNGVFPKVTTITVLQNLPRLTVALPELRRVVTEKCRVTISYLRRSLPSTFQQTLEHFFSPCQIRIINEPSSEDVFYQVDLTPQKETPETDA